MKRGDVVAAAGGGGFGGKPRPFVVVQSDTYRGSSLILVGCHSADDDRVAVRPLLHPTAENGLQKLSEVTIDTPVTMRIEKIDRVIGTLSEMDMEGVDTALLLMFELAETRSG